MKVLVLLEVGVDTRAAPERDPRSGRVREQWLVREPDPGSARALGLALRLKAAEPGVQVTVLHLGPRENEGWLRDALARGCDQAVRVEDDGTAGHAGTPSGSVAGTSGLHAAGKAVILAAAAQVTGFDLVLAGAAGVVDACGHLGVSLAEHLGVRCVTQATGVEVTRDAEGGRGGGAPGCAGRVRVTRALSRGFVELVEASLPLVVTVAAAAPGAAAAPAPVLPVTALLAAQTAEMPRWDLADLGVPLESVRRAEQSLRYGRPRPPQPRLRSLAAPDSSLPAFERILALIQGAVKRREGRVVCGTVEEVVEEVFQILRDGGWLDHLRPGIAVREAAGTSSVVGDRGEAAGPGECAGGR